jgi:hypothetical protein
MNVVAMKGEVKLEMKSIFKERDIPLTPVGYGFGVAGLTSGCGLEELHFLHLIHFFFQILSPTKLNYFINSTFFISLKPHLEYGRRSRSR